MQMALRGCNAYLYFNEVLFSIVNKGNGFVILLSAIYGHSRTAIEAVHLQDSDVIKSLPKPVVNFERFPIRRQAWRKTKSVHFKLQSQK